jgi:FKBP-type peptidyl-prolyl cis-trans isomerase FklB
MRVLKVLVLVLMPLVALTACDQKKSDAATAGPTAGPGVPGSGYDTSADASKRFLADYAARPDVKKLPDGLMYRVLKAGNGPAVQKDNDVVTVYYKGELINGKVFDQTKPEEPAQFPVGGLIPGWVEALKLMKTGDTWELVIPSDLGYGADGAGDTIPPNATLVFVMTLAKVEYAP